MKKYFSSRYVFIFCGLLSGFLVACKLTSILTPQESAPTPEMNLPTSTPDLFVLPAPLFYLQNGQIWRMDVDTQLTHQLTQENVPIDSFDISTNDMLVYVSNNKLIISNAEGKNRQVLRSGSALTPIADTLASLNDLEYINLAIRSPYWSPDGQNIAFIENGLQIFNLESGKADLVWSQSTTSSEPMLFESVLSWSPDGNYLLVSQYAFPIDNERQLWLSLLELNGYLYRDISKKTGETFAWSADTNDLFLANASFGSNSSLIRCEPVTGKRLLIAEFEPARQYYFYAHPFVNRDGNLQVFISSSNDPIQPPDEFHLFKLRPDGYGRNKLRSNSYQMDSALWAKDGTGVLIRLAQETNTIPAGTIMWVDIDDGPEKILPLQAITNMRWGID